MENSVLPQYPAAVGMDYGTLHRAGGRRQLLVLVTAAECL